jgi:hypothetical protein
MPPEHFPPQPHFAGAGGGVGATSGARLAYAAATAAAARGGSRSISAGSAERLAKRARRERYNVITAPIECG